MSKGWDNATLKKLKALTAKGLSTAEIGKRIGMSKNAVVGKLNRLGWNLKASSPDAKSPKSRAEQPKTAASKKEAAHAKKKNAPAKASVKHAAAAKSAPAKPKPAPSAAKSSKTNTRNLAMHQRIIQHALSMAGLRPNQCRWPHGDPDSEDFHFCGAPIFVGKPYCYEHCRQAYQLAPPKKKQSV
ncbi:MAG: GcrA family cell cycle regulator [Rickettsiales bacterium]|jgi:GcrA cell cycle regulator|nr:GcrA family cell cycle regulator [Rickettsiales bacterium]